MNYISCLLHTPARRIGVWLSFFLVLAQGASAQRVKGRVTVPHTNPTVKEVMRAVMRLSDYLFAYDGRTFDARRTVKFAKGTSDIATLLDAITAGTDSKWRLAPPYIVIYTEKPKPAPEVPAPKPSVTTETPAPDIFTPSHFEPLAAGTLPARPFAPESRTIPARRHDDTPAPRSQLWVAFKTNLAWVGVAMTPNLGIEVTLGDRSTFQIFGGWIQLNRGGRLGTDRMLNYGIARAEYRHWFGTRHVGPFIGLGAVGTRYDIAGYRVPTLFAPDLRYRGWGLGATISYGYGVMLARHVGLEFHLGCGMVFFRQSIAGHSRPFPATIAPLKVWVGPTSAGINLSVFIGG